MGTDLYMASRLEAQDRYPEVVAENRRLKNALREILKGEGRFSRDPLTHASNTIEDMQQIARKALGETK